MRRGVFACRSCLIIALLTAVPAHAALVVSSKPTKHVNCSAGVCTPTGSNAVLNVEDMATMLANGDVKVASWNVAQDLEIDVALSWTSSHRLTLDAWRSLVVNKPVTVAGLGGLTILTNDGDGDSSGDLHFYKQGHIEFWDTHGSLIINGGNYVLLGSVKEIAREFRHFDGSGKFYALRRSHRSRKVYSSSPIDVFFNGTFEGLGNAISNLKIQGATGAGVGLFYALGHSGVLRDLSLRDVDISGSASGQYVGSLFGGNNGSIINCHSSGKISATGASSFAGGLAGASQGPIMDSSSAASASAGPSGMVGGLTGENASAPLSSGSIEGSYATGSVVGGNGAMVGGLAGVNFGTVLSNSYATGGTTGGSNALVGGLVGYNGTNSDLGSRPVVSASYSTGAVFGGSGAVIGGVIGSDTAQTGTSSAYWDLDTSGVSNPHQGAGNVPDDPGITGLTDAQLKSGLPAGFDPKVWAINPKINNGYPYLIANPPPK